MKVIFMISKEIKIKIEESKSMPDYIDCLYAAIRDFWTRYPWPADIPLRKGKPLFRYKDREFDVNDFNIEEYKRRYDAKTQEGFQK